jgi:hypothetical protein
MRNLSQESKGLSLGDIYNIGITEVVRSFIKIMYLFYMGLGYILGDFLTISYGHPSHKW